MQFIYNELSEIPITNTKTEAISKIVNFIKTFIRGREDGFKSIHFSKFFHEIFLSENFTLANWVKESNFKTFKDLLLAAARHPALIEEGLSEEKTDEYIMHTFYFENDTIGRVPCEGMTASYLLHLPLISFKNGPDWEKSILEVIKSREDKDIEKYKLINIFSPDCFVKQEVKEYLNSLKKIELIETNLSIEEKEIHLRDDHGKDDLLNFSNKLVKSPYVLSIINSLPFNPKVSRFIKNIFEDGKIEIVLYWDDRGIGLVIQTTGRSFKETEKIAEILKEEYE